MLFLFPLGIFSQDSISQKNRTSDPVKITDEIIDIPFEELLNYKITTATKTEKKINEVPAIIDVVTREQIVQRGYQTLAEVLNDICENHEDRSNWGIGEPLNQNVGFGFRFDTGQNILLLFNGQRLNAFLPGNRFGGEEYLLNNIDRIEIIRGPGSSLYGANAFTAVVNIISRSTLNKNESGNADISVESKPTSNGYLINGSSIGKIGNKGLLSTAFRYATEEGQDLQVKNGLFGDQTLKDGLKYAADGDVFFTQGDLRVYSKYTRQVRNTFTGFNAVNPTANNDLKLSMYAYSTGVDYTLKFSDKLNLKLSSGWHQDNWTEVALIPIFKVNATGDSLIYGNDGKPVLDTVSIFRNGDTVNTSFVMDGQGADTRTIDGDIQFTYHINKKNSAILGFNYSDDKILHAVRPTEIQLTPFSFVKFAPYTDPSNNWLFDLGASRYTKSIYGQADYDFGSNFMVNAGGRFDQYGGTGILKVQDYNVFNPRVGLVYKQNKIGNIKMTYGSATRVPNGFETLSSVTILGNPNNTPEQIQTIQVQWMRSWTNNFKSELGAFHSNLTNHLETNADLTEDLFVKGFIGQFVNVNSGVVLSSIGVDGKLQLKINKIKGVLNFTRYLKTDNGNGADIPYIPTTMINGNANVPIGKVNFNMGFNYRGAYNHPSGDPREQLKGYFLLNANVMARLSSVPVEFRLGGRNLLNSKIAYPSSSMDFTEYFPGREIELFASIKYTFN